VNLINTDFLKHNKPAEKYSQLLIIAGGDGTLNRVINTIPEKYLDYYIFGIIAAGTANEFAKALKIPIDIEKSAELIVAPKKIHYYHIGEVNGKFKFATGILYGLADYVLKITPKTAKHFLGCKAFHYGVAKLFWKIATKGDNKFKTFEINSHKVKTNYLLINNASLISKNIEKEFLNFSDRTLFSLVYLRGEPDIIELFVMLLKNHIGLNMLKEKNVHYSHEKELNVDFSGKIQFLLDGDEYEMVSPLAIRFFDRPLAFICG